MSAAHTIRFRHPPPENWTVRAFLSLTPRLSNDFTAAWLTFTFPQLFAVAATLKSIDYNVAMTFILNNNNNNNNNPDYDPDRAQNWSVRPCPDICLHAKCHPSTCTVFWVILLTDRQTDKQTDKHRGQSHLPPPLSPCIVKWTVFYVTGWLIDERCR